MIIRTAHEWGKTVTAHVYCVEHIRKLAKYGIDGMEHCSLIDEDTADLLADQGIYIVPTFCPYEEAVHYDPVKIQTKQPEFKAKLEYYKDALQAGREVIKNCKCKLVMAPTWWPPIRIMKAVTNIKLGWKVAWEASGHCMRRLK